MIFELIVLFAVVYFFRQPLKAIRVYKPGILKSYAETAVRIFGTLIFLYGASWAVERLTPAYADLIPGLVLILVFPIAKIFGLPEPLCWLAFGVWAYLAPQNPAPALLRAFILSLGVPFLQGAADGLRFRLAFTPSHKTFSNLPGLIFLFALAALIFSGFFQVSL